MIKKQWVVWWKNVFKKIHFEVFRFKKTENLQSIIFPLRNCAHTSANLANIFVAEQFEELKSSTKIAYATDTSNTISVNKISLNIWRPFHVSVLHSGASCEPKTLRDVQAVSSLQDQAQMALCKHVQSRYPDQPTRFGKLLLMLPALRSVSASTVVEVFFKKTIGDIPLERLLIDMYKSNDLWRRLRRLSTSIWHSLWNVVLVYRYYVLVCRPTFELWQYQTMVGDRRHFERSSISAFTCIYLYWSKMAYDLVCRSSCRRAYRPLCDQLPKL